ncbi:small membrane protein [Enterobacter sp. JUb54]|nr:small membrane protein [Enterobacter sp. JUb54]QNK08275.1 small membrane protein [Enterobacter sp. JUb54]
MVLQTWLALLLCIFLLCVSVYSLITYIKDRNRQKFPLFYKNNRKR